MSELAARLHLEISTMTRVIDGLVTNGLATRVADSQDRRICRVRISRKGQSLVAKIRAELVKEYELVLREIPAESREAVISAMSHLLSAFRGRKRRLCGEAEAGRRGKRRVG